MRALMVAVRRRGRVLVATAAIAGVAALAAYPVQAYRAQQARRGALSAEMVTLVAQNRALRQRAQILESDEEIERLARLQYNLVRPGEEVYSILPSAAPPPPMVAPPPPNTARPSPVLKPPAWKRAWTGLTSIF